MSNMFLPLLKTANDDALADALGRIGSIIISSESIEQEKPSTPYFVLADKLPPPQQADIFRWLDEGADKVAVPPTLAKELIGVLPEAKLILLLDAANVSAVSSKVRNGVSGVLLKTSSLDVDLIGSFKRFFTDSDMYILSTSESCPSLATVRELRRANATLVVSSRYLTLDPATPSQLNVADAFFAPLSSDRPDGLIPTVISSHNQGGQSLGLVYSSAESIRESIVTGKGVYQSRKHGLWRKGETSGATQQVVRIRVDCDMDSLEFSVVQSGTGFCHLGSSGCFGELAGIPALEQTLRSRLEFAPEGSYTRRLFEDLDLLRSKIMEEAEELCDAENTEDVTFEAADLIYFAMTMCVSKGVSLVDIEQSLAAKAKKVTRRPGNAKPHRAANSDELSAPPTITPVPLAPAATSISTTSAAVPTIASTALPTAQTSSIRMRTVTLAHMSQTDRHALLRRPVLKSDEMIAKVRPIVESVRTGGDAALLSLTLKFDKAQLTSPVIFAPFSAESMDLDLEVKKAIDTAYQNIHKFHLAQAEKAPLVVETMPGVVCTRFARPISRVGLYVPGGTAILPSTALMLGIPAQVAGCQQIVLATPPRADGSIAPEVMYVAKLVGASAVLKAGGGQAVAALAYGTETVPKVDKIFGPGNQWVTAAKMLVQNDTDALVSIDMPAGPSEVMVIADSSSNPAFVAADLLSQAEHGVDSQVVLVAIDLSDDHLAQIEEEVEAQANALPRVTILRESVQKSLIVKVQDISEAVGFSNDYAPEHLILQLEAAQEALALVQNAGSVFVGPWTPESCGDYASGTNHTLPTNGYARQFSGVNTQSFQKHITSQEITREGLQELGPVVVTLAECEGLEAHANAVRVRLQAN